MPVTYLKGFAAVIGQLQSAFRGLIVLARCCRAICRRVVNREQWPEWLDCHVAPQLCKLQKTIEISSGLKLVM